MLYKGKNLTASSRDILEPVELENIYESITSPSSEMRGICLELKRILQIDPNAFDRCKVRLPYFCGSSFKGNIRKIDNFIQVEYFVLDIDHCFNSDDLETEGNLKEILKKDQRIALLFTSPSGTGLKAVFHFTQPITDSKRFSDFYMAFARKFAQQYDIERYIDFKTHDVSRVCFLSIDPNACFNPSHVLVDYTKYLSPFDALSFQREEEKPEDDAGEENPKASLDKDIYKEILHTLNPKSPKRKKNYVVPEILETIVEPVTQAMNRQGLEITEIRDISYGKKFRLKMLNGLAEINIYYGRNGFTIVKSAKCGTNEQLNEIAYRIACSIIYDFQNESTLNEYYKNMINRTDFEQGKFMN